MKVKKSVFNRSVLLYVTGFLLGLLILSSFVLYTMISMRARWQAQIDEFVVTVPLGITQEEVRSIHGEPMQSWGPNEAIDFRSFDMVDPREDDATTVWFYYFGTIDGGFLYFDDEGILVKVELART